MTEQEPVRSHDDRFTGPRPTYRTEQTDEAQPRPSTAAGHSDTAAATDDAQVASEGMSADATLSRLGDSDPQRVPPSRQLSGEPPAS